MQKTLFISCFFNLVGRNILYTDVFKILSSKPDLKIVLLVPAGKGIVFEREFGGPAVMVEEIQFRRLAVRNLLFHLLSWHLLSTKSKKIHKLVQLKKDNNYFNFLVTSLLAGLGKSGAVRRVFRTLDYLLMPRGGFGYLFNKYNPDLVLATDIQDLRTQEFSDTTLIREAKRRGVASIGLGRSWDSMTTKGLLRTLPDKLVVQTEDIKKQAVEYHSVDPESIYVVGTPHYDKYINSQRTTREVFFIKTGLDPNRRLILLVLPSDIWTGDSSLNIRLLELFAGLKEQVVVRFPIFGKIDVGGFAPSSNMVFDSPNNSEHLEESLLDRQDDDHLADLLYHSDVVVTGASSIIVDAAMFNKPAVLIGFDGDVQKPYWASMKRYYDYEHQKLILDRGFFQVAYNKDELIDLVKTYINNPLTGAAGRKKVAETFCPNKDGRSGLRLADLIWNTLTQKS